MNQCAARGSGVARALVATITLLLCVDTAHSESRSPDWSLVIRETRERLGPVRPTQTCVEYSEAAMNVCRFHGFDCFQLSFVCSDVGHSVLIGREASEGKEVCRILDVTNRAEPADSSFDCRELDKGSIEVDSIYCDDTDTCRCSILAKDEVHRNSDPYAAAALYRPTLVRSLFGAHSRCLASCQEHRSEHERQASLIGAGCRGELALDRKTKAWGLGSWLAPMSRHGMCTYAEEYIEEMRDFYQTCVSSCNSFGKDA